MDNMTDTIRERMHAYQKFSDKYTIDDTMGMISERMYIRNCLDNYIMDAMMGIIGERMHIKKFFDKYTIRDMMGIDRYTIDDMMGTIRAKVNIKKSPDFRYA